jgi:hypothetical protein
MRSRHICSSGKGELWTDPRSWTSDTPSQPNDHPDLPTQNDRVSIRHDLTINGSFTVNSLESGNAVIRGGGMTGLISISSRTRLGGENCRLENVNVRSADELLLERSVTITGGLGGTMERSGIASNAEITIDPASSVHLRHGRLQSPRINITASNGVGLAAKLAEQSARARAESAARFKARFPEMAPHLPTEPNSCGGAETALAGVIERLKGPLGDTIGAEPYDIEMAELGIRAQIWRPASEAIKAAQAVEGMIVGTNGVQAAALSVLPHLSSGEGVYVGDSRAYVAGSGELSGDVTNFGLLIPELVEAGAEQSGKAALEVRGSVSLEEGGEIRLLVSQEMAKTRVPLLLVSGGLTFESRLDSPDGKIHRSPITASVVGGKPLLPGYRVPAIRAKSTGRPTSFGSAFAADQQDVFLALDHWQSGIDLLAVHVPRYADGSLFTSRFPKANIILITHGTASQIAGARPGDSSEQGGNASDLAVLATKLQELVVRCSMDAEWDVVMFDWREFATGSNDTNGNGVFQPFESARVGQQIGISMVDWLVDGLGYGRAIKSVQLIGHSSGAWVCDGMADQIKLRSNAFKAGRKPHVTMTLFDAFDLPGDGYTGLGALGEWADEIEHYLDPRVPGTCGLNAGLPSYGVTVQLWEEGLYWQYDFGHAWPYAWYLETVQLALNEGHGRLDKNAWEWKEWGVVRAPFYRSFLEKRTLQEVQLQGLDGALRSWDRGTWISLWSDPAFGAMTLHARGEVSRLFRKEHEYQPWSLLNHGNNTMLGSHSLRPPWR